MIYGYLVVGPEDDAVVARHYLMAHMKRDAETVNEFVEESEADQSVPFWARPEGKRLFGRLQGGDIVVSADLPSLGRPDEVLRLLERWEKERVTLCCVSVSGARSVRFTPGSSILYRAALPFFQKLPKREENEDGCQNGPVEPTADEADVALPDVRVGQPA